MPRPHVTALIITLALVIAAGLVSRAADAPRRVFRAGAYAQDVTPTQFPVIVNGMFTERTADRAVDPLHARCLVLDDGSTRIALAVVDSCMMPRELLDRAKAIAARATGIPADHILISATHTHSAPSVMGCLGSRADEAYAEFLVPRIARGIEEANKRLAPAKIGWGVVQAPEYTHARRWIFRPDRMRQDPFGDLTVRANMHPGYQSPDAIGPSGPADPGLSVLSVQSPNGTPIALLANYSMHYFGSPMVSADYFGLFAKKVTERLKSPTGFVAIMSQGTSGDLWLADYGEPQAKQKWEIDGYTEAVVNKAMEAYNRIEYRDWVPLAIKEATLTLGRRVPDAKRLAWAKEMVAKIGDRLPQTQPEVYAKEAVYLHDEPTRELKLQAIGIGDLGIAAIPNEVFALTGLKIKALSPFATTFTIELANGAEGYIPPPEQHALGGYTTWPARTAGLEVQAEPKILEAVVGLLETVAGKPRRQPADYAEPLGAYPKAVIASQPIGYLRFSEMSGQIAESTAGQLRGSYSDRGVGYYLDGPPGEGFSGKGTNRCVHFADGSVYSSFTAPATYSAEMWFWNGMPPEARPVAGYLFSLGPPGDKACPGDHLGVGGTAVAGGGKLFFFNGNQSNTLLAGRTPVGLRTWNHVVLVRDGTKVTVYLNGNREPEIVGEAPVTFDRDRLALTLVGTRTDDFAGFEGKIDEYAFYDRALPPDEVAAHYEASGIARAAHPLSPVLRGEGGGEGPRATGDGTLRADQPAGRRSSPSGASSPKPLTPTLSPEYRGEGVRHLDSEPKSPADSLAALHVKGGFEVELVAAEPLVVDPVAFDWGADGRLWVVEMADYPYGLDGKMKPGSRIKVLEDTDGDGKYDKATLFLDGVNFATGVLPWRHGVLVTAAPEIFYAEDTDGDGKADVRRTLYRGFKEGNPQLRVNGLRFGLDNWVYCANGWSGGTVRSEQTGATVDLARRSDLRIRPDDGSIEPVSGVSQYGRNRDDWGNWFGVDNSHPLFHYVLEEAYLRRNPSAAYPEPKQQLLVPANPPVYPRSREQKRYHSFNHASHFTSACSAMVYRDELLFGPPKAGVEHAFVCEPVHNLVQHAVLTEAGDSFTASRDAGEESIDFLASEDPWFRPVMVRTGPDGALYVADMYRYMIEHPDWLPKLGQDELRPFYRNGDDKGRIYRVYPKGKRPRPVPRLDKLTTEQLVAALDHPGGWQRDTAQMLLLWRHDPAAAQPLRKLAESSPNPLARLHALCTLDGMNALKPETVEVALIDDHPAVRRHAVRLVERLAADNPRLVERAARLVDDLYPKVWLQLACSLGEWDAPVAGRALAKLSTADPDDPWLVAAVVSSAPRHYAALVAAQPRGNGPVAGPLFDALSSLASERNDRDGLARLLATAMTAEGGVLNADQMASLARWLDTLRGRDTTVEALASARPDDALARQLADLPTTFDRARRTTADPGQPPGVRAAALSLLGREKSKAADDLQRLAALLDPQTPGEVQTAAVRAMGRAGGDNVPTLLIDKWAGLSPQVHGSAVDLMLGREPWAWALLEAVEARQVAPQDLDPARRDRLLRHPSARVKALAAKLFGTASAGDAGRQQVVESMRPVLAMDGDAKRGAAVFAKNCATCHRLGGVGQEVGPDLRSVRDWEPDALLTAILDPNRAAEPRYLAYTATLADGEAVFGVITNESAGGITIQGLDGKERQLSRSSVRSLAATGRSLMPDGFESGMTRQEIADLIRFLKSDGN